MPDDIAAFVARWIAAWNAHDVDGVLDLFADDAHFTSPLAARIVPESGGRVQGRTAIRAYWLAGLAQMPDLRFTLLGHYAGIDTIVIRFANQLGQETCEVLRFAGGKAVEGWANRACA